MDFDFEFGGFTIRYREVLLAGPREDPGSIREDVRLVAEAQDDGEEGDRVGQDLR